MKSYGQLCGIAKSLDLIGDRWTLLIIRDLLLGPLHYVELLQKPECITTNLLAGRLKDLENNGLISRDGDTRKSTYQLPAQGQSLEPVLFALGQWGWQFMDVNTRKQKRNIRWTMVSEKRRLKVQDQDYTVRSRLRMMMSLRSGNVKEALA